MLPTSAKGQFAEGCAGAFDETFRELAAVLVGHGHQGAILRIGWEFNGRWFPWSANNDLALWVRYWRRIATLMKSTPGSAFQIDWSLAMNTRGADPEKCWPGTDLVDYVGMSLYDDLPLGAASRSEYWHQQLTGPRGLNWQREFAAKHGTRVSFPEWGTGKRPNGQGGGDDPDFISNVARWMDSSDLGYHNYFDYSAKDFNCRLSAGEFALSGARFRQEFGRQ